MKKDEMITEPAQLESLLTRTFVSRKGAKFRTKGAKDLRCVGQSCNCNTFAPLLAWRLCVKHRSVNGKYATNTSTMFKLHQQQKTVDMKSFSQLCFCIQFFH
jgi:hypothetical protein